MTGSQWWSWFVDSFVVGIMVSKTLFYWLALCLVVVPPAFAATEKSVGASPGGKAATKNPTQAKALTGARPLTGKKPVIGANPLTGAKPLAPAAGKNEKMFTIKSASDMGPMEINMSSLGLRLKGKIGLSLWRPSEPNVAILINPENRTYLTVPVEEYIDDLREEDFPIIIADRNKLAKSKKLPGGFSGTECTVTAPLEDGSERVFARVIGVKNPGVSQAVHRMWCQYSGFVGPDIGVPVSIYRVRGHGAGGGRRKRSVYEIRAQKLRSFLVPVELKSSPLVASYFAPPAGYRKAKDKAALYLSSDGDMDASDMEDLFRVPMK